MKQSLSLRMSQHLALTPQLQQSIRLLQLSTLELNQELEQILADNPLLERTDEAMQGAVHLDSNGMVLTARSSSDAEPAKPGDTEVSHEDTPAPSESEFDAASSTMDSGIDYGRGSSDDDDARPQMGEALTSLREHLHEQLRLERLLPRRRALVAMLIDSLDDDGYLHESNEELEQMVPEEFDLLPGEIANAVRTLQNMDPPGVGARTIGECLHLQLIADTQLTDEVTSDVRQCAMTICSEHLNLLALRDYTKLRRALGCGDDILRSAHALIKRLNPYPGSAFSDHEMAYVVPDVVVRKLRGDWTATLNPDVMPKLRINEVYAAALREARGARGSGSGAMSAQLQEARWLIKNVQQRFDTILRVAQAIVDRQRGFFTHGEVAMRPLVLREIADTLGLHESTVSRVTTQKYMLTPTGTFELKYFFGSHVATETGGAASSTAIRALIKQLIGAENPKNPLSDSKLAEMLGEQGIVVARRTVAKYREALKIAPVNLRKLL
ncbi:RNA polymerase factor sigma-54 [soil metagenome]